MRQALLAACVPQPRRALVRCAARNKAAPSWKQPPRETALAPVDVDDIHAEFMLPHEVEEAEEEARGALDQLAELRAEAPEPPPAPAPPAAPAAPLEYVEVRRCAHARSGQR